MKFKNPKPRWDEGRFFSLNDRVQLSAVPAGHSTDQRIQRLSDLLHYPVNGFLLRNFVIDTQTGLSGLVDRQVDIFLAG